MCRREVEGINCSYRFVTKAKSGKMERLMDWIPVAVFFSVSLVVLYISNSLYLNFVVSVAGRLPRILKYPLAFLAWLAWALVTVGLLFLSYTQSELIFGRLSGDIQKVVVLLPGLIFGLAFGIAYMMVSRKYRKKLQDLGFITR